MAGIDRSTGRLLSGWDLVVQSIMIIITTGYGERMLRRWFGSSIPQLLGETLTTPTVVRFFAALIAALEVREIDTGHPSWFVAGRSFIADADRLVVGDTGGGSRCEPEPAGKRQAQSLSLPGGRIMGRQPWGQSQKSSYSTA